MSLLLLKRFSIRSYDHILDPKAELTTDRLEILQDDLSRLLRSEPVQYVLGECEFCSRNRIYGKKGVSFYARDFNKSGNRVTNKPHYIF